LWWTGTQPSVQQQHNLLNRVSINGTETLTMLCTVVHSCKCGQRI